MDCRSEWPQTGRCSPWASRRTAKAAITRTSPRSRWEQVWARGWSRTVALVTGRTGYARCHLANARKRHPQAPRRVLSARVLWGHLPRASRASESGRWQCSRQLRSDRRCAGEDHSTVGQNLRTGGRDSGRRRKARLPILRSHHARVDPRTGRRRNANATGASDVNWWCSSCARKYP